MPTSYTACFDLEVMSHISCDMQARIAGCFISNHDERCAFTDLSVASASEGMQDERGWQSFRERALAASVPRQYIGASCYCWRHRSAAWCGM